MLRIFGLGIAIPVWERLYVEDKGKCQRCICKKNCTYLCVDFGFGSICEVGKAVRESELNSKQWECISLRNVWPSTETRFISTSTPLMSKIFSRRKTKARRDPRHDKSKWCLLPMVHIDKMNQKSIGDCFFLLFYCPHFENSYPIWRLRFAVVKME